MNQSLPIWQLLTGIAVPTLMVLIGILLNERGVGRAERRLERLEDRAGHLEGLHYEEIVMNDNGEQDYLDYVRDPANGFRSMSLPIKGGTELSVKVN